ncbi:uncharacterized protein [Macrobrachium rosenbergii]|uniref:uncharacterized protein n=1 Tax=Macrobrachium rosenbergii TaxID=79674 RepID=UPI0034D76CDC
MRWFFLLGLLAVSVVQALPDAEKKNGERLVLRAKSKRDLASAGRKAEGGTHVRRKRDAEEPDEPGKPGKPERKGLMNLDIDIDIKGSVGKAIIDIDVDAGNG